MKVGIVPVNIGVTSSQAVLGVAMAAEAAGLESVWTCEHVIVPNDYDSKYHRCVPFRPSIPGTTINLRVRVLKVRFGF